MAKIIIQRTSEYMNRFRNYQLFIDGKKIGTIANGQTKEFETTVGQHTVTAKIDWCSSPEISFELDNAQNKVLCVGGIKYGRSIVPVIVVMSLVSFLFQRFLSLNFAIWLIIPSFILLIYYLTAGRKKYLTLTTQATL